MIMLMQVQDHLCLARGKGYLNYSDALPAVTWLCDGHMLGLSQSNAWLLWTAP